MDERARSAGQSLGQAQAAEALTLPELPIDCRRTSVAGLTDTDDLLAAVGKYDVALTRQNARTVACAAWFDGLRGPH